MKSLIVPCVDSWQEVDRFSCANVDSVNWPEQFPYAPQVSFRIAHTKELLLLEFSVSECDPTSVCKTPNGPVWEDSCVEFFVKDPQSEYYYNFETNSICTPLVGCRKSRHDCVHFTPEQHATIKRSCHLPENGRWSTRMEIPFASIGLEQCPKTLRANFYKCGDKTAVAHFLSWSPIDTPTPDFHRPEFFGELLLA